MQKIRMRITFGISVILLLGLLEPPLMGEEPPSDADHLLKIAPLTSAAIQSVAVKEGQKVKRGDILFRLDDEMGRASVEKIQSRNHEAELILSSSIRKLAEAKACHQHLEHLYGFGHIPMNKLALSQQHVRDAETRLLNENIAAVITKIKLLQAKILLKCNVVRAPVGGTIHRLHRQPGDAVWAGETVVTIQTSR